MAVYNTYENINFFITRAKPYNPKGRNQTAEESDQLSTKIRKLYDDLGIIYTDILGNNEGYDKAIKMILEKLKESEEVSHE